MRPPKEKLPVPTRTQIDQLKEELTAARLASLEATRRGDFMTVARMTARQASLNTEINEKEGRITASVQPNALI